MDNPVLVEVTRGGRVESRHRGAVAVFDADARPVARLGDTQAPVYPRSAVKAIQALPLIESGAADAFGFSDREIALACASHSGEAEHVALAASMLARADLVPEALECGAHWPAGEEAARLVAGADKRPSALHNNCSGKHAGFICTCRHLGRNHSGYIRADHPAQSLVRESMESLTGRPHGMDNCGTDGCSIPTYAVPLDALAIAFARMATGTGLGSERAKSARRILSACMAEPYFVAGIGRMDTRLMKLGAGRLFVKTGAEGVYCGAVPELGLGLALKIDDGASRASETAVAAVLAWLLRTDGRLAPQMSAEADRGVRNWNGIEVGRIRSTMGIGGNDLEIA